MVPQTLRDLFADRFSGFGSRIAVRHGTHSLTYDDLAHHAERLAGSLRGLGVGPGVAVALMMANRPEYLVADQAILRLGATKVPVNSMLTAREIDFILGDSGARVAIADERLAEAALASSAPDLRHIVELDSRRPGQLAWHTLLENADDDTPPNAPIDPTAPATLLYTGGTTGRQKGVVHTQAGATAVVLAHVIELGLADDERMLLTTPLAHAAGAVAQAGLLTGATLHLEARYDASRVLDLIAEHRITFTFMVPTMIYRLLDHLRHREADTSSLRTLLYGAAPMLRDRLAEGLARFGRVFVQLYGQTEAPNFITRLGRDDHDPARPDRLGSCGRPALLTTVEVHDDHDRNLGAGEPGEICVRGPYLMDHYHRLPDKTAETLRGGWLHTGDIGVLDEDGYLHLLDRKSDMLISGGMNVYCAEVENMLLHCPDVDEVAVVGLPHPDWGEAVAAFVVTPDATPFDEDRAGAWCREHLAGYKRPKVFVRVPTLPTTPYGKVDKKSLRADFADALRDPGADVERPTP